MGSQIQVVIQDSGHGIPSGDLNRVFDPFFSRKQEGEHKGMGLSIVKSVIETHEGKVAIESGVNSGTRVLLTLPMRGAQASSVETSLEEPQWENLPDIATEKLMGQKPITGSNAEDLPAAPAKEEVTWVGRDPDLELLADEEEGEMVSDTQAFIEDIISDSQSLKAHGGDSSASRYDEVADDFEFDSEISKRISVVPMTEQEMQEDDSQLGDIGGEVSDDDVSLADATEEPTREDDELADSTALMESNEVLSDITEFATLPAEEADLTQSSAQLEAASETTAQEGLEDDDDDDDFPMIAIRKPKVGHES